MKTVRRRGIAEYELIDHGTDEIRNPYDGAACYYGDSGRSA
ncbi:MAG TPA: hypothetical protein VNK81_02250 [Thermodesulfobacteriota bacterium]|nr:hypothetical protein [Thermodesulfobacteriota bacterium]